MAQPCGEMPFLSRIARTLCYGADPEANGLDPMFVKVVPGYRFACYLANGLVAIRPERTGDIYSR